MISAESPYFGDSRATLCHMYPADTVTSSSSEENIIICCSEEFPVADQIPFPFTSHQKFRVPRSLCRFSMLAGANKKWFWSVLASPARFGAIAVFSPVSLASGKYNPLWRCAFFISKLPAESRNLRCSICSSLILSTKIITLPDAIWKKPPTPTFPAYIVKKRNLKHKVPFITLGIIFLFF